MQLTRRLLGLYAGASAAAAWTGPAHSATATPAAPTPGSFDPTPYVNPQLQKFVAPLLKIASAPFDTDAVAAMRQAPPTSAALGTAPLLKPALTEQVIAGVRGAPDVRIYVINARAEGPPRPAILHIHGGGFVAGTPFMSIRMAQEVAQALDSVVVSVDYRLAPETKFPGALEDNYTALKWLHANADKLGADISRIAVMGESAGGGHAAMLTIAARDRGEIPLAYQALIYPMLDDRTGSTRKTPPQQGALIWTPQMNRFGWSALLGVPAGSPRVPYGSVPARVQDLRGLPPAFIGVGSIDLFFEEDLEYGRRLADAGVLVTLNVVPGAFHGFDIVPGHGLGKPFRTALINALADGLRVTL